LKIARRAFSGAEGMTNRRMIRQCRAGLFGTLLLGVAPAFAGSVASSNFMIPNKDVVLHCAPLRYKIHCSIARTANPQYSSFCFYVDGTGNSYPMKRDYRFGFYNDIVNIKVDDGLRIAAQLTELRSGKRARCSE
jgi:hypothetical protein